MPDPPGTAAADFAGIHPAVRLDLAIDANGRRDEVVEALRREVVRLNRARGGSHGARLEMVPGDSSTNGHGDSDLLRITLSPALPNGTNPAPTAAIGSDELFLALDPVDADAPPETDVLAAAVLLGTEVVTCRSVAELAATVRDRLETRITEVEAAANDPLPRTGLGWPWFTAGFALLALCPGPWLRHFGIDFQIPPLDWRVLAPRHPEYVPIWVPPTIGAAFLVFAAYTLWRVRRIRRARTATYAPPPPPRPSRAAPLVAALLLVPFLTNTFFTIRFFQHGRIIELATEAIHSQGFGMLTAYYPLEEFDLELDQFRYARPMYHMSPNILPFWQPWAFAIVFILSFFGTALLAVPWRRRILFGSRRLRPMDPRDQGDPPGGPNQ